MSEYEQMRAMILDAIMGKRSGDVGPYLAATTRIMNILAEVWEDGYETGDAHSRGKWTELSNPYKEQA